MDISGKITVLRYLRLINNKFTRLIVSTYKSIPNSYLQISKDIEI